MTEIFNVLIYSIIGIILMFLGSMCIDLVIPCNFPEEIKRKNVAIGFVMAGIYVAIAIIIKASIITYTFTDKEISLVTGLTSTLVYSIIGVLLLLLGYLISDLLDRKYNLNEELSNGNQAAGIMVAGIFIGIAIVISGVIV